MPAQITQIGIAGDDDARSTLATQNGGSARGYRTIYAPLAALSSPGHGPIDGRLAVYLCIGALEVNVLNCRI